MRCPMLSVYATRFPLVFAPLPHSLVSSTSRCHCRCYDEGGGGVRVHTSVRPYAQTAFHNESPPFTHLRRPALARAASLRCPGVSTI